MRSSGLLIALLGTAAACGPGVSRDPLPGAHRLSGLWSPCGKLGAGAPLRVAKSSAGDIEAVLYSDGTIAVQRSLDHSLMTAIPTAGGTELALSHRGARVAIAGGDRLAVWRTGDGVLLFEKPGAALQLAFSPDETKLLVVTGARVVEVRDADDGTLLDQLEPFAGPVTSAAFDADSKNVAVYDSGAGGVNWYGPDGRRFVSIDATAAPFDALLSPRGDHLALVTLVGASGDGSGTYAIDLYDAVNGPLSWSLYPEQARPAPVIAFSPDGMTFLASTETRLLAAVADNGLPRFLEDSTGLLVPEVVLDQVTSIAFPTPLLLADASGVYELARGDLSQPTRADATAGQGLTITALAFSPDGRWLATAGYPQLVRQYPLVPSPADVTLWDLSTRGAHRTFHGVDATSLSFSSDSRRLLAGTADAVPNLREYTLDGGDASGYEMGAWLAAYGAQDRTALVSSSLGLSVVTLGDPTADERQFRLAPYPGFALSPDRRFIATTGPALWRADDISLVWPYGLQPVSGTSFVEAKDNWVAFSPDGASILTSDFDASAAFPWVHDGGGAAPIYTTTTRLHRAGDGALVRDFGEGLSRRPAFSPDGAWIVAGSRVYAVEGEATFDLPITGGLATVSAFGPDGTIAVGREDGVVELYCPM